MIVGDLGLQVLVEEGGSIALELLLTRVHLTVYVATLEREQAVLHIVERNRFALVVAARLLAEEDLAVCLAVRLKAVGRGEERVVEQVLALVELLHLQLLVRVLEQADPLQLANALGLVGRPIVLGQAQRWYVHCDCDCDLVCFPPSCLCVMFMFNADV